MRRMALTVKQEKFAQHYAAHRNGTAAYRHAFDVDKRTLPATVNRKATELLAHGGVSARIEELSNVQAAHSEPLLTRDAAHAAWMAIATADPRELIGLRVGCCRYCWGPGHAYQWRMREYTEALAKAEAAQRKGVECDLPDPAGGFDFNHTKDPNPDCPECRGEGLERVVPRDTNKLSKQALLLYGGVKAKRDGIEIVMADRQKALEHACRISGVYDDKVRLSGAIETMNRTVQMEATDPKEAARLYQELMASPGVRT
jgi:hypothetical protein